jgi:Cytochrome P450/Resolvase, N terminal domain
MSTEIASIRSGLPPGPKGTIVGGNSGQFRARPLDFLLDTGRDYGPLASFRVGPRRVFLASGPDLIEQVLVTDARHYIKHFGARAFKPVLGNGLVTSEGALWHRQRKLIQPAVGLDCVCDARHANLPCHRNGTRQSCGWREHWRAKLQGKTMSGNRPTGTLPKRGVIYARYSTDLRLLERAREKAFNFLIVKALDRLSRDMEDLAGIHKRLSFLGIEIRAVFAVLLRT